MALHIVSLNLPNAKTACLLEQLVVGDDIVIINAGELTDADTNNWLDELTSNSGKKAITPYLLLEDPKKPTFNNIPAINGAEFVQLSIKHSHSISWF